MKLTFKDQKTNEKFKEFVCENKDTLDILLWYLSLSKNPIIRIASKTLDSILDIACPEKKTN